MNGNPTAVEIANEIRISHRGGGINEIDFAPEQRFQVFLQSKIALEEIHRHALTKCHQKVQVAPLWIKVVSRRRADQLQSLNGVLAAQALDRVSLLSSELEHGRTSNGIRSLTA